MNVKKLFCGRNIPLIMAASVLVMLLTGAGCFGYGLSAWIRWFKNRGR